ncbi:transposase [Aporhodopirellula aestuarii]|uniref:Transposase IS200-like domain-containing protein n=1 Tax=Aporhodopirellula aestuarii TaxID=2950107 RepID=A0ABT0TZ04_9BACT|nr:transposase [Aporhodopirellula aestuarii]MCM2369473.1 hypothetical protein [Aporhodopirellula aestuarii]
MSRDETSPVFRSLDPQADLEITERNLPHWFQIGAAMFITFRTGDSLPKEVLLRWQRELEHWLKANELPLDLAVSTAVRKSKDHHALLETLSDAQRREFKKLSDRFFHRSLNECHGKCLLRRPELAELVGNALLFYNDEKYDLDRFVVMPNHVHAMVQFRAGATLEVVSQSWMRYSARQIRAVTGDSGVFWQPEPFDHIIRSPEKFEYLQRYIFDNPRKANLRQGEFLYWQRPM